MNSQQQNYLRRIQGINEAARPMDSYGMGIISGPRREVAFLFNDMQRARRFCEAVVKKERLAAGAFIYKSRGSSRKVVLELEETVSISDLREIRRLLDYDTPMVASDLDPKREKVFYDSDAFDSLLGMDEQSGMDVENRRGRVSATYDFPVRTRSAAKRFEDDIDAVSDKFEFSSPDPEMTNALRVYTQQVGDASPAVRVTISSDFVGRDQLKALDRSVKMIKRGILKAAESDNRIIVTDDVYKRLRKASL
jgi:hypothetical protein